MADRYWVGGSGTWNSVFTANWSATSGGGGGASVPTSADNVFFNSASNATAYTVTMGSGATCADMTMAAPATGNVTWSGSTGLTIAGSMTVASSRVTRTYTGQIFFTATTTGKTITIGVALGGSVTFDGVGGGWTLGSALTVFNLTCTNGSLDTSAVGNYAITCSGNFTASSANAFVLSLNASTLTIGGSIINVSGSGLTFNAGTSQINITGSSGGTISGSRTYYNLAFTSGFSTTIDLLFSGSNTFNNLAITGSILSNNCMPRILFGANQTINGTLTGSGATVIRRMFFLSNVLGTARTLTLANPATISNADFQDITAATNAINATTGGGDCGGNTNITFPAAKTVYWNLTGSQQWYSVAWAATSGGSPALSNFPLAQDTAVFDNAGAATTVSFLNNWNIGTLNMSARTSAVTITTTSAVPIVYGSWLNGTGTTLSGTGSLPFSGRGNTQLISGNGRTFTQAITVQNIGGTVQLTSAFTTSSTQTFTLTNGTLDLQSFTLTTGIFSSSNSNVRTIAFGTGNLTLTGTTGTIYTTATANNFTVSGTRTVNVTNNTASAIAVVTNVTTEARAVDVNILAGTYDLNLGSQPGIRDLNFTGFSGSYTLSGFTTLIFGNLTLSATATYPASGGTMQFSATSGSKTITTNGKTMDFPVTFDGVGGTWALQDALTMGSTRTLTHTNGTIDLNGRTLTLGTRYTTATGTKNLTFNGGTLVCPGVTSTAFNNQAPTNYTTTAGTGTGTISMTGATAKTFVGAGSTYNCTLNQGGAGALTISGANTFNNIANSVQPASVRFTGGTTNTFNNFNLNGTAGNLITIDSTGAGAHTLSKASGTVTVDYLSITDSNATGGATWNAGANSVNGGGNTGWIFAGAGGNTGAFFSVL